MIRWRARLVALWSSLALRLAVGHIALTVAALAAVSLMFYFGTIGVLSRGVSTGLHATSARLANTFEARGRDGLRDEILRLLSDDVEVDTEVYELVDADGQSVIGNLSSWSGPLPQIGQLIDWKVVRSGRSAMCRLLLRQLGDGEILVVGRKMEDQQEIERLVASSLATGGTVALVLALVGAVMFRRVFDRRIAMVRHVAASIDGGNLSERIPVAGDAHDEFSLLGRDINHMLDRIQHLMDGVRHVSNAIAHDLRTPLGRIRGQLDRALSQTGSTDNMAQAVSSAVDAIDDLIQVFEKLLLIAEVESGANRHALHPVAIGPILSSVAELYDAMAEEKAITLSTETVGVPIALGDRDLLAAAIANLVNNAVKYTGAGGTVQLRSSEGENTVSIVVHDNGPGIPVEERANVVKRFYRLDPGRNQPGNGLGLSMVAAVATLHHGTLSLEDGAPGLLARITLPRA